MARSQVLLSVILSLTAADAAFGQDVVYRQPPDQGWGYTSDTVWRDSAGATRWTADADNF